MAHFVLRLVCGVTCEKQLAHSVGLKTSSPCFLVPPQKALTKDRGFASWQMLIQCVLKGAFGCMVVGMFWKDGIPSCQLGVSHLKTPYLSLSSQCLFLMGGLLADGQQCVRSAPCKRWTLKVHRGNMRP